jgi:hypothetical protein
LSPAVNLEGDLLGGLIRAERLEIAAKQLEEGVVRRSDRELEPVDGIVILRDPN